MAKLQDITTPLLQFTEGAAAATPASGVVVIYAKSDGLLYGKNDAGNEALLSSASVNQSMTIALSDESTAITTGAAKITFRAPFAMTLYQIPRASLSTASSSGAPAIDINVGGTSIFTTTLTIDATEKTSTTAATAAVMTSSEISVSDDAEITIDIDTAGTGAKGLKVILYYRRA